MESTVSSLPAKVALASLDVGGKLSADKRNTQQNYDYLSADKILSICGQALAQQGVIIFPDIAAQELVTLDYTDGYGKAKSRHDCKVEFLFHLCDGTSEIVMKWYGIGSDYAAPDKALYKAITSGHKYFLMKLLCIGAGNEDSEHEDEPAPKAPAVKPAQRPQAAQDAPQRTPAAQVVDNAPAGQKAWSAQNVTLDEAQTAAGSDNQLYWGLDSSLLAPRLKGIDMALAKPETTDDRRAELEHKKEIILAILKYRNVI